MSHRICRSLYYCLGIVAWLLIGSTCWAQDGTVTLPFSYVILGSDTDGTTVALARTIVPLTTACSQVALHVQGQSQSVSMTTRLGSPIAHFVDAFPVKVCEAKVQLGDTVIMSSGSKKSGIEMLIPNTTPERVVLFGDTGCKPKDQDGCSPSKWPFQAIIEHATIDNPDLVIHLGDYNYRGTPSHVIDSNGNKKSVYDGCTTVHTQNKNPHKKNPHKGELGAFQGDNWTQWQLDFFVPAQPLLQSAPWVVMRGNHELCSRAGPGWFYFLSPSSNLTGDQIVCPKEQVLLPLPLPSYSLTLDGLQLVVMDSANACDDEAQNVSTYETMIRSTVALAGKNAWFLTHHPLWSIVRGKWQQPADTSSPTPITDPKPKTVTLSQAANSLYGENSFPASISLVLSGHMHEFESLTFNAPSTRSPMLILGNGGVAPTLSPLPPQFSSTVYGSTVIGSSTKTHGYLFINSLTDAGTWTGTLKDSGGKLLGHCSLPVSPGSSLCQWKPRTKKP